MSETKYIEVDGERVAVDGRGYILEMQRINENEWGLVPTNRRAPVKARRVDGGEIMLPAAPASPSQTVVQVKTSRVDQAKGFTIKSAGLAFVVGLGVTALRAGLQDSPLTFAGAVVTLIVVFASTWLISFAIDTWLSPDGIALTHTLLAWRYYYRDQSYRQRRGE